MAGAQFCAICGDIISDGCPVLDADGNETDEINYSPCQCDIAARQPDYTPVVGNDEELAKVFFVASDIGGWMIDLRPFEESTMATSRGPKWIEWDKKRNAERAELREKLITGIQAVREALAARAVQVPDVDAIAEELGRYLGDGPECHADEAARMARLFGGQAAITAKVNRGGE